MQYINMIENKLIELEGGKFQRLCNDLINRQGYGNVTNSGGKDGTDKTVKGTPDSYILLENGKFVFIEYTVQQSKVFDKFKKDIEKCLDESKTNVLVSQIDKIIIMYNSSLSVGEINDLKADCEKYNVKFENLDINCITQLMSTQFPFLAKDHLGISIDNGQFLDYRTFVERNDKSVLSTPLNLEIVGRESEIADIIERIEEFDFIVVSGRTGVGKTKLVIEALQKFVLVNKEYHVWYVKDRGQGLYEDLLRYTSKGKHVIYVDDINKQTSLVELLDYFSENSDRIKVISTVRDYALSLSVNTIGKYVAPEVYPIEVLSDETIIEMLKNDYDINNPEYHSKIVKLAKGNIRLAVMMAIIAVKENTLDSISNIGKLLEQYYSFMADKLDEYKNEKMLMALSSLAFIDKLHLESEESMKVVESITGIEIAELKNIFYALNVDEVVDIYEGEIVSLTDQIVAVFIFHYVYEVKQLLDYKVIIDKLFPTQKNRIVQNINGITAYYDNIDFFEKSVKELMSKWKENDDERYRELLLTFWFVKPEETLVFIDEEISKMEADTTIIDEYLYDRNVKDVTYDSLLSALGHFSHSESYGFAIMITLKYLKNNYSKVKEVSKMLIENFGYNTQSYNEGYQIQHKLVKLIVSCLSDEEDREIVIQLFCNISSHLLQFTAEYVEANDNRSITIYTIPVRDFGEMSQLRTLIWKSSLDILKSGYSEGYILKLLEKYGQNRMDSNEVSIIELDYNMLQDKLFLTLNLSCLKNCVIIYNIENRFKRSIGRDFSMSKYDKAKSYELYTLLKCRPLNVSDDWKEGKKILSEMYREYAEKLPTIQYAEFVDDCNEISNLENDRYSYAEALVTIIMNAKDFRMLLEEYIDGDTPFNANPLNIIEELVKQVGFFDAKKFIESKKFSQKEYWRYLLFSYAKDENITLELYDELLEYYQETNQLSAGYYRSLDFLEKWIKLDNQIFSKIIKLIFQKEDEVIKKIYFFYMFHDLDSFDKLAKYLDGDKELLEYLYLYVFINDEIHDSEGLVCRRIINNNKNLFKKILAIVCNDKVSGKRSYNGCFDYSIFWEQNDEELIEAFEYVMGLTEDYSYNAKIDPFLFDTSTSDFEVKKRSVIKYYIKRYSNDEEKMTRIFYTLANYDDETRIYYYEYFVSVNDNVDSFIKLPFDKSTAMWSGSEIPRIVKKQTFFSALVESFSSSFKLLKHRNYLQDRIDRLENYKRDVRIREILRDI